MQTQEQLAATQKAYVDMLFGLTNRIVESVEQLAQLNAQAIRSALTDTLDQAQKSLSVKEPREWLALQDGLVGNSAEKVQAYHRQLFEIVTAIQTGFAQVGLAQWEAYSHQARTLVADLAQSAPGGSETPFAALDSALTAANALYETMQRSAQQAAEITRGNLDMAVVAASQSVKRTVVPAAPATKR
ncbi:phasin family protein [Burkholderia sp. Bp8963]|uniref:TIGR01841 family phasin n=1 Tax=Burkholderia sp. Bp8963 TaxID=2184547 RepID=UPI000F5A86C1|nr:TIGR01841 family phasin [Burkholderia sp. Bp8963]RQS62530.1 phasin family protein [Burkholderia sp. Bp8963]